MKRNRINRLPPNSSGNEAKNGTPRIRYRCQFNNTIRDVLRDRGWLEVTDSSDYNNNDNWDLYWGDREVVYEIFDTQHLDAHKRLNHYRNARELCRKDLLVKNLKKRKRQLEKEGILPSASCQEVNGKFKQDVTTSFDFYPVSFVLPREYALFVEEFKRLGGIWIMKPIGSAQGKGIFLFTKLHEISEWKYDFKSKQQSRSGGYDDDDNNNTKDVEAYIVQRYIANPYCIGGKKFDLRLYVLVTSFMPLTAYLYQGGFARFTQTRYSNEPRDVANNFMHLTNVSVQKKSEDYDEKSGGKMDIRSLKLYMSAKFGIERVDALFFEIQSIITKSLQSVQHIMIQDKHCFELFGYDVIIDDNLKPWLIEVNASPSLTANTQADYDFKAQMLHNVLDIVDMEQQMEGDERVVGGFVMIISQNNIVRTICPPYSTILGTKIAALEHSSYSSSSANDSKPLLDSSNSGKNTNIKTGTKKQTLPSKNVARNSLGSRKGSRLSSIYR